MCLSLKFSENQIKAVFQKIASDEYDKIRHLNLGSWHEPKFSQVHLSTLRSVMNRIQINDFKILIQIKNIEMSIEQLQKLQEENDKIKDGSEDKLTDEEMKVAWTRVACEAREVSFSMPKRVSIIHNHQFLAPSGDQGVTICVRLFSLELSSFIFMAENSLRSLLGLSDPT